MPAWPEHHRDLEAGADCPGRLVLIYETARGVDVFKCQECGWSNDPRVAWRRERDRRAAERTAAETRRGTRAMKLKLSVHRKLGAPNYGSDGAGAEIEIELDPETPTKSVVDAASIWYRTLETVVGDELARLAGQHAGQAGEAIAPAEAPRRPPEPPPAPPADERPSGPPPRQGGGQGRRDDPPKNGKQLLGWANSHGAYDRLMSIAKQANRGPIREWDEDMVSWAYDELARDKPTSGWGGR